MALIMGCVAGLFAVLIMLGDVSSDPAQAMVQSMFSTGLFMILAPVSLVLLIIGVRSIRSARRKAASPTAPRLAAAPGGIGAGWSCGRCGRPLSPYRERTCSHCQAAVAEYPPVARDTPPEP